MTERGELVARRDAWHERGTESPHRAVDVRAGGGHVYPIVLAETGELLGTADERRALRHAASGRRLPAPGRAVPGAGARPGRPRRRGQRGRPGLLHAGARRHRHRGRRGRGGASTGEAVAFFGTVHVTNQVVGYVRKLVSTNEIDRRDPASAAARAAGDEGGLVDDPAAGVRPRGGQAAGSPRGDPRGRARAIGLLPLVATCDRWDIGGVSTPLHDDTGITTIFVYDGYPGGAGITERGFRTSRAMAAGHVRGDPRSAPARAGARAACSRRSAATGTSRWTSRARPRCSPRSSASPGADRAP